MATDFLSWKCSALASCLVLVPGLYADTINPDETLLTRTDSLPAVGSDEDSYLEGYIQALLDVHFHEHKVVVIVRNNIVYLANLPKNDLIADSIQRFVKDLPGVQEVQVREGLHSDETTIKEKYAHRPQVEGVWFPQSTVLFSPLIADPRDANNSVAYRFGDKVIGRTVIAVSIGDDFPLFRWRDVFRWHGDLQIGIEGAVWAVFNYSNIPHVPNNGGWSELVNTDYYVGIPLTYAYDRWSFRLRLYHISGHLGDEFIVNHPEYLTERKNPSFEAIDLFGSYQFSGHLRGYLGAGVIFHSDPTFRLDPLYVQYGLELHMFGQKLYYHSLYGSAFMAINLVNYQQHNWDLDTTCMIGYEVSKLQGIGRKARVFAQYHHGFSYEGQFFNERTQYGEIGFSWGF